MKTQDLRIGNIVEYKITDSLDERKEWWELNPIDVFDLQHLVEFPEDVFFRPIPLTEEWLLKLGFELQNTDEVWPDWKKDNFELLTDFGDGTYEYNPTAKEVLYVHQLQNLFHALTGEELTYENN